jgi:hypothetical protein
MAQSSSTDGRPIGRLPPPPEQATVARASPGRRARRPRRRPLPGLRGVDAEVKEGSEEATWMAAAVRRVKWSGGQNKVTGGRWPPDCTLRTVWKEVRRRPGVRTPL